MINSADPGRGIAGILVGGQSTRMGRPKASLPLVGGRTLVEHVVQVASELRPWVHEVVLLGDCPALPPALATLIVLPDLEPGAGPLAGLCVLLQRAGERWGLLLACDLPLITPTLLKTLLDNTTAGGDAIAFQRSDRPGTWHACCALYHPRILPAARHALRSGRGSLQGLLASVRVTTVEPNSDQQRMLTNLNTPADYARLIAEG